MAFRKTYRSGYLPTNFSGGFGEVKYSPSSSNGSSITVARVFETPDVLNDAALPLMDAAAVISSGIKIDGSVDFAPSDRAVIDSRINDVASRYISSVKSSKPE